MARYRVGRVGKLCQIAVFTFAPLVFSDSGWSQSPAAEPKGAKGGDPFQIICPANNFVVGVTGRAGGVIEKVQLLCAPFSPARPVANNTNFSAGKRFEQGSWMGAGQGGSSQTTSCTTGTGFVKEIRFNTAVFNGFTLIEHIQLECSDRGGHASTKTFGRAARGAPFRQRCGGNDFVVGFHGRVGLHLDALGVVCAPMP